MFSVPGSQGTGALLESTRQLLSGSCLVNLANLDLVGAQGWHALQMSWLMFEGISILADANSIAQQALANIRTVYSFNGEERTSQAYAESLQDPLRVRIWYCSKPAKAAWTLFQERRGCGVFAG